MKALSTISIPRPVVRRTSIDRALDTSKQSIVKTARSEPKGQAVTNDQAAVSDPLLSNKLDMSESADTKSVLKSDPVGSDLAWDMDIKFEPPFSDASATTASVSHGSSETTLTTPSSSDSTAASLPSDVSANNSSCQSSSTGPPTVAGVTSASEVSAAAAATAAPVDPVPAAPVSRDPRLRLGHTRPAVPPPPPIVDSVPVTGGGSKKEDESALQTITRGWLSKIFTNMSDEQDRLNVELARRNYLKKQALATEGVTSASQTGAAAGSDLVQKEPVKKTLLPNPPRTLLSAPTKNLLPTPTNRNPNPKQHLPDATRSNGPSRPLLPLPVTEPLTSDSSTSIQTNSVKQQHTTDVTIIKMTDIECESKGDSGRPDKTRDQSRETSRDRRSTSSNDGTHHLTLPRAYSDDSRMQEGSREERRESRDERSGQREDRSRGVGDDRGGSRDERGTVGLLMIGEEAEIRGSG